MCCFCFLPPPCSSGRRSSLAPSCFSVFYFSPLKHSFRLFYTLDTLPPSIILMLRIDQDPTNVPCLDFTGAAYAAVQQAMSANGQITNKQAAKQLTAVWNQTHAQVVFAGPVRWTGKKTEIGLNPTAKDRTTGCGCTNSEFFRLPVAMFVEKSKNRKKPV